MSIDLRYPIVFERILYCSLCRRYTSHHSVVYPDTEYNKCKVEGCSHKVTIHYDREVAVIYKEIDEQELEGIENDLNSLAGKIVVRDYGHMGKKDRKFLDQVHDEVLAIRRRILRLKERKNVGLD